MSTLFFTSFKSPPTSVQGQHHNFPLPAARNLVTLYTSWDVLRMTLNTMLLQYWRKCTHWKEIRVILPLFIIDICNNLNLTGLGLPAGCDCVLVGATSLSSVNTQDFTTNPLKTPHWPPLHRRSAIFPLRLILPSACFLELKNKHCSPHLRLYVVSVIIWCASGVECSGPGNPHRWSFTCNVPDSLPSSPHCLPFAFFRLGRFPACSTPPILTPRLTPPRCHRCSSPLVLVIPHSTPRAFGSPALDSSRHLPFFSWFPIPCLACLPPHTFGSLEFRLPALNFPCAQLLCARLPTSPPSPPLPHLPCLLLMLSHNLAV
ncbi:hypothetical protein R3P38DRAFT_3190471 [Favolaschia claudopus]|uniref:Uncharacterized protein n=1 Tax=Favolaschia claudopus TaxID=2862362 RepID=A0AAW0BMC9_9AGAR